jgi:hypothetical protein
MNKTISFMLSLIIFVLGVNINSSAQTIEQRLVIVENQQTLNGAFRVQVQVKGTSLPAANTLGSATIDVQFDNTHFSFVNGTLWAFGSALGYSRDATNNTTFIRVGVLGSTVNGDGGGDPPGLDIGSTYTSWVQLNFTILNPAVNTNLTIDNTTNAIGIFENQSNEPKTGVINNQILTTPENIVNVPLPVELTSFTSKLLNDKVLLNWSTKTEVNNYGFDVERKVNGNWQKIGFVEGNGNSNSPKEYSFSDNKLVGGSTFNYRLKQIDNDGQFEYSDIIEVVNVPTEFALFQNYPNPFNPSTKIRYQLPAESKVVIKIYNILGSEVMELVNDKKEAGVYEVNFNADNLSSGTYIYKINADNFVQTKKMILIK